MKILTKILTGLLSFAMIMPGSRKLIKSYEEIKLDPNMKWVEDFSPMALNVIGGLEVLAFLGLILPYFTKLPNKVRALAAAGAACTMVGAIITHIGRGEPVIIQSVILIIALAVSYLTFKETKA